MVLSNIPEELAVIIANRRPHEPHKILAEVSAAPNGALLVDRDSFSDEEWADVEGYQALRTFGLGSASALKLSSSPSGQQTYMSFFAAPDAPTWSREERDMIVALTAPLQETLERLSIPLLRHERLMLSVFEEKQVGVLVVRPLGGAFESNFHSFELANRYASSLGIPKGRHLLRDFVDHILRQTPSAGDRRRRLRHPTEACYLEVSEHEIRPGVYAVSDPCRLLLLQEHVGIDNPLATLSPRIEELSPALKKLAVLMVTSDQGMKQIAAELGKSVRTVRKQNEKIYKQLGVGSRAALTLLLRGR
jgi:DNA-binding CsgD family transcriptional regulator